MYTLFFHFFGKLPPWQFLLLLKKIGLHESAKMRESEKYIILTYIKVRV